MAAQDADAVAEMVRVGDQLATFVERDAGHQGPEVCGRNARRNGLPLSEWCSYCEFVVLWRKLRAEYLAEMHNDGQES